MQMGMEEQVLSPTVQQGEETDLRAQVLRIGGDGAQSLCRSTEEDVIEQLFVLIGDGGNLFRQGEDDVEIGNGEEFRLAVLQPLGASQGLALGTMPISAAMVSGALVATAVTLLQMAAQSGGAAEFDGAHHAPLSARERSSVFLPVSRTVAAKDLRHFELGTLHQPVGSEILRCGGRYCRSGRLREQVEGAGSGADLVGGNAQVAGRSSQTTMPQQ